MALSIFGNVVIIGNIKLHSSRYCSGWWWLKIPSLHPAAAGAEHQLLCIGMEQAAEQTNEGTRNRTPLAICDKRVKWLL